jgi:capsular exopolysaccharide synthesis family protein
MNRLFEALSEIEIELLTPAAIPHEPCASGSPSAIFTSDPEANPITTDAALPEAPASESASEPALPILIPEEKAQKKEAQDFTEGAGAEISASDHSSPDSVIEVEIDPIAMEAAPIEESRSNPAAAVSFPEENLDGVFSQYLPTEILALDVASPDPEQQPDLDEAAMYVLPRDVFPTDVLSLVLELRPESEQSSSEAIPAACSDIPVAQLEMPCEPVAILPLEQESAVIEEQVVIKEQQVAKESQPKAAVPPAPPRVILKVPPESRLVALTDPDSLGAEKFRALAARLEHQHKPDERKCFQVTSSVINEGKTLVSGNIGITLAKHFGAKTLLVEGDLHRPTLASIFGLERLRGISHWWSGHDQNLTPFVHKLEGLPLWFLPAGRPSDRPSDVLRSSRFVYAFEKLASEFEWVVVDSTPMVPIVDVNLWSRLVNGTLLVVREGVTPVKALQKGLQALDHPNLIGMVLNDAIATIDSKYDGQYYGSSKVKAEWMNKSKRRIFPI